MLKNLPRREDRGSAFTEWMILVALIVIGLAIFFGKAASAHNPTPAKSTHSTHSLGVSDVRGTRI